MHLLQNDHSDCKFQSGHIRREHPTIEKRKKENRINVAIWHSGNDKLLNYAYICFRTFLKAAFDCAKR